MIVQTMRFIDLADLAAFRFVCKSCDMSMSISLSDVKLKNSNMPPTFLGKCRNCGQPWAELNGSTWAILFHKLGMALNALKTTLNGDEAAHAPVTPLGFKFSLEIKPEIEEKP